MAKASMVLTSGAIVTVEGTPEEVARILELNNRSQAVRDGEQDQGTAIREGATARPALAEIVNKAKSCDEAEIIEARVLDKSSQVDRVLLPLYLIHEYFQNQFGLTTGEISAFTTELGSQVSGPNVSHTIRGPASKYVLVDVAGAREGATRYKLNRRGVAYMKTVLGGSR